MTEQNNTTQKPCGKCGVVQELTQFNKNKNRPDGLAWDCKTCNRNRCKKHFEAQPEKYKAANKVVYENNKDRYLTQAKQWAADNKEKRRAISKAYTERNPEARKQTAAKYREENKSLYAAHDSARRTRRVNAMPAWADEAAIRAIYDECSRISKETGVKHHVDHYYPLKNELVCGLHVQDNLRIITAFDNLSKGNQIPTEES